MKKMIAAGMLLLGLSTGFACDVTVRMFQVDDGEKENKGRGCIEISVLNVDDEGVTYRDIKVTDYRPPEYKPNVKNHRVKNGKTITLLEWGIFDLVKLKALGDNQGELKFRGGETRKITITDSGVPVKLENRYLCIRIRGGNLNTQPVEECKDLDF